MAQLIDKSALVAEIIRRRKAIPKDEDDTRLQAVYGNEAFVLTQLLEYIDTLEMKDVDLEKEVDIEDAVHGTVDYPLIGCDFPNIYPNYKELKEYCDRKGIKDNDKVKLIIIKDM